MKTNAHPGISAGDTIAGRPVKVEKPDCDTRAPSFPAGCCRSSAKLAEGRSGRQRSITWLQAVSLYESALFIRGGCVESL